MIHIDLTQDDATQCFFDENEAIDESRALEAAARDAGYTL